MRSHKKRYQKEMEGKIDRLAGKGGGESEDGEGEKRGDARTGEDSKEIGKYES